MPWWANCFREIAQIRLHIPTDEIFLKSQYKFTGNSRHIHKIVHFEKKCSLHCESSSHRKHNLQKLFQRN